MDTPELYTLLVLFIVNLFMGELWQTFDASQANRIDQEDWVGTGMKRSQTDFKQKLTLVNCPYRCGTRCND